MWYPWRSFVRIVCLPCSISVYVYVYVDLCGLKWVCVCLCVCVAMVPMAIPANPSSSKEVGTVHSKQARNTLTILRTSFGFISVFISEENAVDTMVTSCVCMRACVCVCVCVCVCGRDIVQNAETTRESLHFQRVFGWQMGCCSVAVAVVA